jgi:hypothetical protein
MTHVYACLGLILLAAQLFVSVNNWQELRAISGRKREKRKADKDYL